MEKPEWQLTDRQLAAKRLQVIERIALEKEVLQRERDELCEQMARLEALNSLLLRQRDESSKSSTRSENILREQGFQIARLRAALERYAQHPDECETSDWAVGMGCTCGLAEALKGAE